MNDCVGAASAIANALVKCLSLKELARLQIILQVISSVIGAEVSRQRQGL